MPRSHNRQIPLTQSLCSATKEASSVRSSCISVMTCDVEHDFVCLWPSVYLRWGFPDSSVGKESACKAEDLGLIPGSGRSAGEGIGYPLQFSWAFLVAQLVKNPPACRSPGFNPWVGKTPWRREQLPTPVFWPGEFHGLYNPRGCKELDTAE